MKEGKTGAAIMVVGVITATNATRSSSREVGAVVPATGGTTAAVVVVKEEITAVAITKTMAANSITGKDLIKRTHI